MTTMLNVITRLGLPGNSTLENRFLSVDIASTLFYWDNRASRETQQPAGDAADGRVKEEEEQDGPSSAAPQHPATQTPAELDQSSRWSLALGRWACLVAWLHVSATPPAHLRLPQV